MNQPKTTMKTKNLESQGAGRLNRLVRLWAWSYGADVIRADATSGYFESPDGFDRQECIAALQEVARAMQKKSEPNATSAVTEGRKS